MERLAAQDVITLWPDGVGWPQDMGALAVLAGRELHAPDGRFRIEDLRSLIESRLHRVARFRQVLLEPRRGLGRPLWVDSTGFQVRDHVRVADVPPPGDEKQLLELVRRMRRTPLSRAQPLWELWFLPGLADGNVGLYLRVHHVVADGPAAVAMVVALLDIDGADDAHDRPWRPAPPPSNRELFEDNLHRHLATASRVLAACRQPRRTASRARAWLHAIRQAKAVASAAPRTSINRPIGPDREVTLLRSRLDVFTGIAHARGATVNDVLLTVVAGGLRSLLIGRGESVDGVVLRAFVPVSLHQELSGTRESADTGNRLGMVIASLPVGVVDPLERLRIINATSARQKREQSARTGAAFRNAPLPRWSVRFLARQRSANTQVSNVPGPPQRLSIAGAELLEIVPLVPLMGNLTLIVGALSYAGAFTVATMSDPDHCPDVDAFAQGMAETLHALTESGAVQQQDKAQARPEDQEVEGPARAGNPITPWSPTRNSTPEFTDTESRSVDQG